MKFTLACLHAASDDPVFAPLYLRAAELLETEPANCIVFEDSPSGATAATAATTTMPTRYG